jgi:hypothetical protein
MIKQLLMNRILAKQCRYPDGRIGSNPALATVAHGEALLAAGVAGAAKVLQALLDN